MRASKKPYPIEYGKTGFMWGKMGSHSFDFVSELMYIFIPTIHNLVLLA